MYASLKKGRSHHEKRPLQKKYNLGYYQPGVCVKPGFLPFTLFISACGIGNK